MARALNRLNARKVETASVGKHPDGGGLVLVVKPSGSKSWVLRFQLNGRETSAGLGAYPEVSLAEARSRAGQARQLLAAGTNPIAHAREAAEASRAEAAKAQSKITFGEAAREHIAAMESSWRNAKHRAQWRMTLDVYCAPLNGLPVDEIATADVLGVLKPLWLTKPETAQRLRGRIEAVLARAAAHGLRDPFNPAQWKNHLDKLLPRDDKSKRTHFNAMPYADVPAFLRELQEVDSISARALEFCILMAARSGEVLKARWREIDFERAIWTRPPEHMKTKRTHAVPLPDRCIAILREMQHFADGSGSHVFKGLRGGLSSSALEMALRRTGHKEGVTVHGFRSAFRDWCGDQTGFQREVVEGCLAHAIGDKVEAAYRRSDALEKRRIVMRAWADFCGAVPQENVVLLPGKGRK